MTPEQEQKALNAVRRTIEANLKTAFTSLKAKIKSGEAAGKATEQVLDGFSEQYNSLLSTSLRRILAEDVSLGDINISGLSIEQKLKPMRGAVSDSVESLVNRHERGFDDARKLAERFFKAYPNQLTLDEASRTMRDELLKNYTVQRELNKSFKDFFKKNQSPAQVRQAYNKLLRDIDRIERGSGNKYLDKKLEQTFYEKVRYAANRIAQTELHRQFAEQQARELMADKNVRFIKYRLSDDHPLTDICDFFSDVDSYGLGRGVYPKQYAPVPPTHPFCRCYLEPKKMPKGTRYRRNTASERAYLRRLDPRTASRMAGSKAKLQSIYQGRSMLDAHNFNVDAEYRVRVAGDLDADS